MPRDISSSSSEDEADSPTQKSPEKQKESDKKTTRYQCPADFVSFRHKPCSSTLTESLKNNKNELWLIKAPASFNPECFSGIKVPLSGLQTLQVPAAAAGGAQTGSSKQIFSILASTHGTSGLSLLTSNKKSSAGVAFGPTFSGLLNVCESYGDSSTNQAPHIIPAAPAPSIPAGLKQRFHPFGSKTPTLTCVAESETDGAAFGPSSTTLRPLVAKRFVDETWHREEEEEGRKKKKKKKEKREVELQQEVRVKVEPVTEIPDYVMMEEGDALEEKRKKKKKKKEKRIKTEREEEQLQPEVRVKVEPVTEIQDYMMMEEGDALEEKRKKKKKDREREEVEEGVEPSVSVKVEQITVKSEPIDTSYGDIVEGSVKKKKKKKKSKTDDD